MFKKLAIILLLIIFTFNLFGEENIGSIYLSSFDEDIKAFSQNPDNRVLLANSTIDYPVTPGDVYKLTYITTSGINSFEVIVASDYSINLYLFGAILVKNMTYDSFRKMIGEIILKAYPDSRPQLILQSIGVFNIYIKGEVNTAGFVTCWGLSRLSEVMHEKTTAYSSNRDINIVSSDGITNEYDLFKAMRFGEKEHDPYLKPCDTIIIKQYKRQVKISGEVFRPDIYQLIEGENLKELIFSYGNGFTKVSDPSRIHIKRYDSETQKAGEMFYIDNSSSLFQDFMLRDIDEVYIPCKKENLPVVYFEGAIESNIEIEDSPIETSNKTIYRFVHGEKLSTAVHQNYKKFLQDSNLRESYIIRVGEKDPIPVDIETLIHDYIPENDILLMPYDRIVIPFRQYLVIVTGAVHVPGQYPYVPGRSYKYYINLAGGTDPKKNINNRAKITDINDVRQRKTRVIQPEDKIYVRFNNPVYHINQWAVFISTSISIAILTISISQLNK